MTIRSRNIMALAAAFSVCIVALPLQAAEGSFERTLKVTGPVTLDVTTGSGDIHVRAGSSATVEIHGAIRARSHWGDHASPEEKVQYLESHPPIEQEGNAIRVGHIEDREFSHNVSIRCELVAPAATTRHSETGSGDMELDSVRGPVKAKTGSGTIRAEGVDGEFKR